MAVSLIDDIYLYTGWTSNAQECYKMLNWLKSNNIKFIQLQYTDETQFSSVFDSLNTWWEGVTFSDFPIVTFLKMDMEKSPSEWEKGYFTTLDQMVADTEFLTLSKKNS